MVKILHAIDTSGPGGAETVFLDIVKGISSDQYASYAVIPCEGWLHDRLTQACIKTILIDSKGSFNISYLGRLIKAVRLLKPDVIHSHLFGSNVYCSLVGLLTGVPVISTFHGFVDAERRNPTLRMKLMLVTHGSKKIVFVSKQLKSYFVKNLQIKSAKAVVIYNGVDTKRFRQGRSNTLRNELEFSPDEVIIGSIGNIRQAKGYDILLQTAALVKQHKRNLRFVIAGEGSGDLWKNLLCLRRKLNLEDTVFFLGFREDTVELLHNFDYFILPSLSEGFSIATIEAMACGLPVIATRSGGPEEILEDGSNGILVTPGDPNSLASAISSLLDDRQAASVLGRNAIKTSVGCFALSRMVAQYESAYRNLTRDFKP